MRFFTSLLALSAVWACACSPTPISSSVAASDSVPAFAWTLPPGLPVPKVPTDNPMSEAKVRLGRRLFYDTRLSGNGTFSCGSCHQQAHAFTDGRARAIGSTGQAHPRSAMSLTNVAYNASYGWADAAARTLEAQIAVPMFNEHPIEMGLKGNEAAVIARLASDRAGRQVLPRRVSRGGRPGDPRQRDQGDRGVRTDAAVGQLAGRSLSLS